MKWPLQAPCNLVTRYATGWLVAVGITLVPGPVSAHMIQQQMDGIGSGLVHPLTGPDHFLAMFAVGLWGAQMGGGPLWQLPVTFPMIMVLGGILAILGLPLPHVELGIALSIITLGAAIGFAWHPRSWIALTLIAFFAICHGYAHGTELPKAVNPTDFSMGFVFATGLIHLLGIGVGLVLQKTLQKRLLIRYLGALIAFGGVYFLMV